MLSSRASLALGFALTSALANAQQLGAVGEFRARASNHNLSDGTFRPSESFEGFALTPRPLVEFSANLVGNTGRASGFARASAGVLKARAEGISSFYDIPNQVPGLDSDIYGGGNVQATLRFTDQITIAASGFFQFSWIVSGGAVTTLGENNDTFPTKVRAEGVMSVVDNALHMGIGRIQFESGAFGRPDFVGGRKKFSKFLNAGDVFDIYGELELRAQCIGGGTMFIDYGNSAYTVIERGEFGELGPGGFTSASGYGYGPVPVPEPASFAALGLAGLALVRRRR